MHTVPLRSTKENLHCRTISNQFQRIKVISSLSRTPIIREIGLRLFPDESIPIVAATTPEGNEFVATKSAHSLIFGIPKKTFWGVASIITGVFVIGAVIAGAIGGTLHHNSLSSAPTGSPNVTPNVTPPFKNPIVENTTNLLPGSSIASVDWVDSVDVTHYHVYFQDTNNSVVQSAWDSQNQTWVVS